MTDDNKRIRAINHRKQLIRQARHRREERRLRRRREERLARLIVFGLTMLVVSTCVLIVFLIRYARQDAEYIALTKAYVMEPAVWEEPEAVRAAADEETDSETSSTDEDTAEEDPASVWPPLRIDFASLEAINSDLTGWIYVPGCDISYPIVQSSDNDYYLDHTFEKNKASSGAIFMDHRDEASFSSFNTFLYGHNMKNGSMFGSLKKYRKSSSLINEYPYFYVYTADNSIRKYRIFSYYTDDGNSDTYDRPESKEDQEAYIAKITDKSMASIDLSVQAPTYGVLLASVAGALGADLPPVETMSSGTDNGQEGQQEADATYMTLSTCHGSAGSGMRFLVHGKLVDMYVPEG